MSIEGNKDIVFRWVAARNDHDVDAFVNLMHEAWHDRARTSFNNTTNAFPDVHIEVHDIFGIGDKVITSWTMKGTHCGVYRNIPATQKQINMKGIDILTIENGKIKSVERQSDNLGLLQQLGVTLAFEGEAIPYA